MEQTSVKESTKFIDTEQWINLHHLKEVNLFSCQYLVKNFSNDLFASLSIKFPESLNNAVVKRKAEYLAGRYAARSVLYHLGIKVEDIPIGLHRSPVWPNNICASITHTNAQAVCAVAYKDNYSLLGVDLENWLPSSTAEKIKNTIIQTKEETLLKNSPMSFSKALTLTFSAKESLFKALYPQVGYYFDFTVAEIINISLQKQSFEIKLKKSLNDKFMIGSCFKGYFKICSDQILTLIAD